MNFKIAVYGQQQKSQVQFSTSLGPPDGSGGNLIIGVEFKYKDIYYGLDDRFIRHALRMRTRNNGMPDTYFINKKENSNLVLKEIGFKHLDDKTYWRVMLVFRGMKGESWESIKESTKIMNGFDNYSDRYEDFEIDESKMNAILDKYGYDTEGGFQNVSLFTKDIQWKPGGDE